MILLNVSIKELLYSLKFIKLERRLISCRQQEEHYYLIMFGFTERPKSSRELGEKPARSNCCYWPEMMGAKNSKLKREQWEGKMENRSNTVFVYLRSV